MTSIVRTVLGDVSSDSLGAVLPHEHLLVDLEWPFERHTFDGVLDDRQLIVEELGAFTGAVGHGTVVDLTVPGIGRDPIALREISSAAGLNVVMGCGWYREPYYGPDVDFLPTERLAESLVDEIRNGVGTEGIRPGIIGEIGSHKGYVTGQEERAFRAAGRAAAATGLSVSTHSVPDLAHTARLGRPVGLEHLTLLEEEGADPARIAIGHCDSWMHLDYHREIARRGAFVQFDNIGEPSWGRGGNANRLSERMIDHLIELCSDGHIQQILLSQDVCRKSYLQLHGGNGYSYLFAEFADRLSGRGFTEADIRTLLYENPRRLLETTRND
jgi:phosphotriesterase-related protein